jgi:hypothetical protein
MVAGRSAAYYIYCRALFHGAEAEYFLWTRSARGIRDVMGIGAYRRGPLSGRPVPRMGRLARLRGLADIRTSGRGRRPVAGRNGVSGGRTE